jgi:hypothetical protein
VQHFLLYIYTLKLYSIALESGSLMGLERVHVPPLLKCWSSNQALWAMVRLFTIENGWDTISVWSCLHFLMISGNVGPFVRRSTKFSERGLTMWEYFSWCCIGNLVLRYMIEDLSSMKWSSNTPSVAKWWGCFSSIFFTKGVLFFW